MAQGNPYPRSTIDEAITLYRAGVSPTEIQNGLNIKEGALYWWLKKLGVTKRLNTYPKHIIDEAKSLYEAGAGPSEIEHKLNLPKYSQQRWFKKMGVTMRTLQESQRLRHERGFCITPTGDKCSNWRGGRRKTPQGYILLKLSIDDFFYAMARRDGCVQEHRLVMAKYLKRCLLQWEIVHHKNGIKDDNRLENLELLPAAHKHISVTRMQQHIKKLETEVEALKIDVNELNKQIRLLKWQRKQEESHA